MSLMAHFLGLFPDKYSPCIYRDHEGKAQSPPKPTPDLESSLRAKGRFVHLVYIQQHPFNAHVSNLHHVPGTGGER